MIFSTPPPPLAYVKSNVTDENIVVRVYSYRGQVLVEHILELEEEIEAYNLVAEYRSQIDEYNQKAVENVFRHLALKEQLHRIPSAVQAQMGPSIKSVKSDVEAKQIEKKALQARLDELSQG